MTRARAARVRRGRLVADVLAGAWRPAPPPLTASLDDVREVEPLLLAAGAGGLAWARLAGSLIAMASAYDAAATPGGAWAGAAAAAATSANASIMARQEFAAINRLRCDAT